MATMCIQSISVVDSIRIHVLSIIFGVWVICKRLLKWIWDPKRLNSHQLRDSPPSCLLDSSLGQHKYVKLKGIKLHYVEAGPRDQPLVLLLHGFPDCWLSWRYQLPALIQHFRVVALDLKGFGDSDKPAWRSSYRIKIILEEIKDFIHALGVSECDVIGHDLGGLVGWYLVHQHPGLVKKFIAVSCPHPNVYWKNLISASKVAYQWLNFVQIPYLPEIDALKEDVKIINQYHKHLPQNDIYLEAYKYVFSRQEDWTGPINYYRNLPFLKIQENGIHITNTVVLITGAKDHLVKLEGIVDSTEYCEKFFMKIIENAGHFPHQENPSSFNRTVLKYLIEKNEVKIDKELEGSRKKLMKGILGAVTNTVKYGNSVFDSVHKRTTDVVSSIPTMGLSLNYMQSNGGE
ncbi:unnamed protein product [Diabrotica balteata]|uniref:AB hydrolase-1 domain-containing protein n=1 Tax=Diabrotica balteata TaxID=107213 RepID=A0A9N9SL95_DIABA|nr:unnamed protein product [Diabrotica balteata]